MKVILLKELKGRGGEGDVIEVANGYANNYLLTQGYAIKATKGNLKQLEQRKHNIAKREETRLADAEAMRAKLDGATVGIAGLGGLGSNLAVFLARLGIGHMILVDFDVVDITNLNRQHYTMKDLGVPKTLALVEQLEASIRI